METDGRFLNADFDVASKTDLSPLVEALAPEIPTLNVRRERGRNCVTLEFHNPTSADSAIKRFSRLVHALPLEARRLWDSAAVRDFDIGVEAADQAFVTKISAESVALAAGLRARILFTIYPRTG